eukprot:scaffold34559_cov60-Phaeocystis_antarctica.AAC.2
MGGAAGAGHRPIGQSNIWARSAGSRGGAASCGVGAVGGAARKGGSAGVVVGSGRWTRPGTAVVVGAGGRH